MRSRRITYHGRGCFFYVCTELKQLLSFAWNCSLLYSFNVKILCYLYFIIIIIISCYPIRDIGRQQNVAI